MLAPDRRSLYTDSLRPPVGWELDFAVAATYSLDLATLMAFPLSLAMMDREGRGSSELRDSVALLEAMRLASSRLVVFCHQGAIHAPSIPRILFSLLEPVLYEVRPPVPGGNFHAKFWLLRFVTAEGDARLRLVLPTRNITNDNCWDLVLTMDGVPGRRPVGGNRALRQLVEALPALCGERSPDVPARARIQQLAEEAHATDWELPPGFEQLQFHAPGLNGREWLPPPSRKLIVVSPFLTAAAIDRLAATSDEPVALIAREEWLAQVDGATLRQFGQLYTLHDQTEPDDMPENTVTGPPTAGLHAKAYVLENGHYTHLLLGSANATSAALFGRNIEIMAELIGRRSQVTGMQDLLGAGGLGPLLTRYDPPAIAATVPPDVEKAQAALRAALQEMADAGLRLHIVEHNGSWEPSLSARASLRLDGILAACAWPIAREYETGREDVLLLRSQPSLAWSSGTATSLTSLVAFELTAGAGQSIRFVLNLPVEGMPSAERDAAILRGVLENRDGFLRYLMLLLGDPFELQAAVLPEGDSGRYDGWSRWSDSMPLLEELARALHRNPERLQSVRRVLQQLGADAEDKVVPAEFRALWKTFEQVLEQ